MSDLQPSETSSSGPPFVLILAPVLMVGLALMTWFLLPAPPPAPSPPTPAPDSPSRPFLATRKSPDPMFRPIEQSFDLHGLTIPVEKLIRLKQPKDGIIALVNPATSPVAEADFLTPESRVVGLTVGGESRAYPFRILRWHEVINDRLGGTDLALCFCSICDAVTVVDRRLGGKTYEFGVSGLLYQSNLLLYDRTDQALWSQLTATALSGPSAGESLRHLDGWEITTFGAWKASHPDSTVVNQRTGHRLPYSDVVVDDPAATEELDPRYQDVPTDPRLPNKARVIGVMFAGRTRAYPLDGLKAAGTSPVRDRLGDEMVEFGVDPATGSVTVVHVPDGASVAHTFWFAWAAAFPGTEIYAPPEGR